MTATPPLRYRRILLKLSGEALMADGKYGIHPPTLVRIASEIGEVVKAGVQIAVVIGGGQHLPRRLGLHRGDGPRQRRLHGHAGHGDQRHGPPGRAGEALGVFTRVQSAIKMEQIAEPYIRRRAVRHLEKGRVVIFAAGTGNPFFTTDTAASLRAMEIGAEVIFKATKVDGVYDSDPKTNPSARRYRTLTYMDVLRQNLHVMDSTAISLCMDNKLPIVVFDLTAPGNIRRAVTGSGELGTLVGAQETSWA